MELSVEKIRTFLDGVRSSVAKLDERITVLEAERREVLALPRDRAMVRDAVLGELANSGALGVERLRAKLAALQDSRRPFAVPSLLWTGGSADDDLLAHLLRGLVLELVEAEIQALPAGISDDDRAEKLAAIDAELERLRASRAEALEAIRAGDGVLV